MDERSDQPRSEAPSRGRRAAGAQPRPRASRGGGSRASPRTITEDRRGGPVCSGRPCTPASRPSGRCSAPMLSAALHAAEHPLAGLEPERRRLRTSRWSGLRRVREQRSRVDTVWPWRCLSTVQRDRRLLPGAGCSPQRGRGPEARCVGGLPARVVALAALGEGEVTAQAQRLLRLPGRQQRGGGQQQQGAACSPIVWVERHDAALAVVLGSSGARGPVKVSLNSTSVRLHLHFQWRGNFDVAGIIPSVSQIADLSSLAHRSAACAAFRRRLPADTGPTVLAHGSSRRCPFRRRGRRRPAIQPRQVLPDRRLADAELVRRGSHGPCPDVRTQDLELPARRALLHHQLAFRYAASRDLASGVTFSSTNRGRNRRWAKLALPLSPRPTSSPASGGVDTARQPGLMVPLASSSSSIASTLAASSG